MLDRGGELDFRGLSLQCSIMRIQRRPAPAARLRKDDVVRMRIPADQKQALIAAAERDGLELSAWLRQLALRAAGVLNHVGEKKVIRGTK